MLHYRKLFKDKRRTVPRTLCGRRDVAMTDKEGEVTCQACLKPLSPPDPPNGRFVYMRHANGAVKKTSITLYWKGKPTSFRNIPASECKFGD
jgi:hypothetical protein